MGLRSACCRLRAQRTILCLLVAANAARLVLLAGCPFQTAISLIGTRLPEGTIDNEPPSIYSGLDATIGPGVFAATGVTYRL